MTEHDKTTSEPGDADGDGGHTAALDLQALLATTSRTFALTIPLLEGELQSQVAVAYLLFRIADTLEDADTLGRDVRIALLARFRALLAQWPPDPQAVQAFVDVCARLDPSTNRHYTALLRETPRVLTATRSLSPAAAAIIVHHVGKTTDEMMVQLRRIDEHGRLTLRTLAELRQYCYAVAGIVGEMLTELVINAEPTLAPAREALQSHSILFGEGLQLTNILKDATSDAAEGRRYIPDGIAREVIFELAEGDLEHARQYTEILGRYGARRGTLAFHALPIRLARRTLRLLRTAPATPKIPRQAVFEEVARMNESLERGQCGLDPPPP